MPPPTPIVIVPSALDLSLLLSAVVERHGRNIDGELITLLAPAWWAVAELLEKDPDALFKIDPRKFEEFIAGKYDAEGYVVTLTPRSGDHGRDIVAVSKDGPTVRIFDQVKAYGRGKVVSANDVRALMGTWAFSDATKGVVTTTAEFAPLIQQDPYITNAIAEGLELVDGDRLLQRLGELRRR